MKSGKLGFFICALLVAKQATAQLTIFTPPRPTSIWRTDTLYIGASFTRNSVDPVSVWLIGNEAGWAGSLYFIAPKTGEEVFLFTNKGTPNVHRVLSTEYDIPVGDTVYFVYRVTQPANGNFPSEDSRKPKYTGQNIPGVSKYVTEPISVAYGHRWSVAGRRNDSIVEFGFEDNVNPYSGAQGSDMDFDDIVFGTTLSLSSEVRNPPVGVAQHRSAQSTLSSQLQVLTSASGSLVVAVDNPGEYSLFLRTLDGKQIAEIAGKGPGHYPLPGLKRGAGLYLLEIRQGNAAFSRTVLF